MVLYALSTGHKIGLGAMAFSGWMFSHMTLEVAFSSIILATILNGARPTAMPVRTQRTKAQPSTWRSSESVASRQSCGSRAYWAISWAETCMAVLP